MAKVPLQNFKQENIGPKTFNSVYFGYAQNNAVYRFMSLNDFSISESRDAEFFEQVFLLKKSDYTTVHDNVPLSASYSGIKILVNEPRKSKRPRVETNFGPDFLTNIFH